MVVCSIFSSFTEAENYIFVLVVSIMLLLTSQDAGMRISLLGTKRLYR